MKGVMHTMYHPLGARRVQFPVILVALLLALVCALALNFAAPPQAAGVVTDCSNPFGPHGFYTALGRARWGDTISVRWTGRRATATLRRDCIWRWRGGERRPSTGWRK